MPPIRLCVVGADGRMGQEVIRAAGEGFEVVGAITHGGSPNEGRRLGELGLPYGAVRITGPDTLPAALEAADVYLSFTTPEAELNNLPIAAEAGKKIVMGTTGLSDEQMGRLRGIVEGRTEAVFASNFSIGISFVAGLIPQLSRLPAGYDVSLLEIHHTGKLDSPSGTAIALAGLIKEARGYSKEVHGRSGRGRRAPDELEVVALRAGGVPGTHEIVIAGPNETVRIEHAAFSRKVFADGALLAARWLMDVSDKKVHSFKEVLEA